MSDSDDDGSNDNDTSPDQWLDWLHIDEPSYDERRLDNEAKAVKDLIFYGTLPTHEEECSAILEFCLVGDFPTLMEKFLAHLTIEIHSYRSIGTVNLLSEAIQKNTMEAFVEHFIQPRKAQLHTFSLMFLPADEETCTVLFKGLQECSALETVSFNLITLQNGSAAELARSLTSSLKTLTSVSLTRIDIGEHFDIIAQQLGQAPNLKHLNLRSMGIEEKRVPALMTLLKASNALETLVLKHNDLGDSWALVLKAMSGMPSLTELDLSSCDLGKECGAALGALLKSAPRLEILKIDDNEALALDATFGDALKTNTVLKLLDLSYCDLQKKDLALLSNALKSNKALKWLALTNNYEVGKNADILATALEGSKLEHLFLRECEFDDAGCAVLLRALKKAAALRSLSLKGNRMGKQSCTAAAELIKGSKTLDKLNVARCNIDQAGVSALAQGLAGKVTLHTLDLSRNAFKTDGLAALGRGIEANSGLVKLYLGTSNKFDPSVFCQQMVIATKKNATLCEVIYDEDLITSQSAKADWATLQKRLEVNIKLNSDTMRSYLGGLMKHFAFVTLSIEDIGERIWLALCNAPAAEVGEFGALRSALRLREVSRGFAAFHLEPSPSGSAKK